MCGSHKLGALLAVAALVLLSCSDGNDDSATSSSASAVTSSVVPLTDEQLHGCTEFAEEEDAIRDGLAHDDYSSFFGYTDAADDVRDYSWTEHFTWVEVTAWPGLPFLSIDRQVEGTEFSPLPAPVVDSPYGAQVAPVFEDGDHWGMPHASIGRWARELAVGNTLVMQLSRRLDTVFAPEGMVAARQVFSVRADGSVVVVWNCREPMTRLLAEAAAAEQLTAAEVLERAAADVAYLEHLWRYRPQN